jgi:hypothetical protein
MLRYSYSTGTYCTGRAIGDDGKMYTGPHLACCIVTSLLVVAWLQEEQDEHEQGKWEGKHQKGKSDKRITESKARQKESTTICTNLAD